MGTTSYSGGAIMEALALFCNHKRLLIIFLESTKMKTKKTFFVIILSW